MKKITLWYLALLFSATVYSQVDVLTQHNDLARTGWNNQETILNTGNVNSNSFGLLYTRTVDDQVFAQPLIASGINIPSVGTKNIVIVCTVNNTIYAFDADDGTVPVYWVKNFTPSGSRVPNAGDIHPSLCKGVYWDFHSGFGIVGTPVIDKASNTMYFVTKVCNATGIDNGPHSNEYQYPSAGFHQYLHAIDISTGNEKAGSPIEITASAPGTGDGNVGGIITFDPRRQFNRAGLALSRGIVYIAYAAHCDWNPCHGWVLGYDASTLQQKIVYITTPNDGRGGIWMSGSAPAIDASGSLYFTTGNAYDDNIKFNDLPSVLENRGESVVKITPNQPDNTATGVNITGYFTPYNYAYLNGGDLDFPIQTMLIPNTNMIMTGCKDGFLYVMDKNNLGGYNGASNNVLQTLNVGSNAQMHSSFAYYGGNNNQYVYQLSENTLLKAFKVGANSLGTAINGGISGPTGAAGGFLSVTSNGTDNSTGILWITQAVNGCNANGTLCQGILRAVRADDVTTELWNTTINADDNAGNFAKMNWPTIANGKVYVPTFSNQLNVYGLLTGNPRCVTNVSLNKPATASTLGQYAYLGDDGSLTSNWSTYYTGNQYYSIDLQQKYSICKMLLYWGGALSGTPLYAQDFDLDVSDDGTNWATVRQYRANTALTIEVDSNITGRYVRVHMLKENSTQGYTINEFQVFGQIFNTCTAPTGLTASNITENTATLGWQAVAGATSYIVQYKTPIVSSWVTRTVSTTSINVSALTCGTNYNFQVQAVCPSGQSAVSSGAFATGNCTATCGALPTRYFAADIGDIGSAGSSCLSAGIYTIKGSGPGISNNADGFQFAFTDLNGNDVITVEVLSLDLASASAKAGIMIRDSVSNTSRFTYLAITNGNGIIFQYRNNPVGPTTIINGPNITAPYWLRLIKTGTQYSAYASPTGNDGSWTQIGTTTALNFGAGLAHIGMAVTSSDNSKLSTATFGSFSDVNSPLPIRMLSFTGENINNEYVQLKWITASETNTDYFAIERSADGKSFSKIAELKAAGNSSINQYYSFNDENAFRGVNFYRVKEYDLDGNIFYSTVLVVNFAQLPLPQIAPNPANNYFIVYPGLEPVKEITVLDASGKIIIQKENENNMSGITVAINAISSGVYIVKIKTATKVYEEKLIKQ
ncbi:MAG: discoidin domain-containing protein [Bacteroidetes bacterium]|nr:discoidin domain-containing protein [Bacteroidota bacterium]MBS1973197.1 discoidin domain-containing protein [Bacteroidota bacterium]